MKAGSPMEAIRTVTGRSLGLLFLWLLVAVPLGVLAGGNDYVLQPKTGVVMIGAGLLAAAVLLGRYWSPVLRAPVFPPLVFLFAAWALGVPSSVNVRHSLRLLMEQAGWSAVFLAALAAGPGLGKVAAAISLCCLAQLGISVLQLNGIWVVGHGELFGPGRIYGTLGNPGFLGVFIAPAAVLILGEFIHSAMSRRWAAWGLLAAGLLSSLFLLFKAAVIDAWIGLALGGAVVIIAAMRERKLPAFGGRRAAGGLAAAGFALVTGLAAVGVLLPRLDDRLVYLKVKAFSWHAAAWLLREHPVLGAGLGAFQLESPRIMSGVHSSWVARWKVPETLVYPHDEAFAHQDFLQMLAETGVAGFGLFAWLVMVAVRAAGSSIRASSPGSRGKAVCLGVLAAFAPMMAFHFPLHLASSQLLFWFCLGWAARVERGEPTAEGSAAGASRLMAVLPAAGLLAAAVVARGFTVNVYLGEGYRIFRSGLPAQAVPFFEKAERLDPGNFEERFYSGAVYQALGNYGEAIRQYDTAVMLYPGMQGAIYNCGNVYYAMGRYEAAIEEYTKALSINPCLVDALNNRGNALVGLGREREAVADYLRAISLMPGYVEAAYNLGYAYYNLGEISKARKWVEQALELDPNYGNARDLGARLGVKAR